MSQYTPQVLFLAIALIIFSAQHTAAENWPRFRGPNGAGQSEAESIPAKWTAKDYNWRIKLSGIGHSSPVVWEDKVVVTGGDPLSARRYVMCHRTSDGEELWMVEYASQPHRLHARNSYASSTPALDSERVYLPLGTPEEYHLVALSLEDGKEVWRAGLGPFESQHGYGTSPMIFGDAVVLANEQLGESFLIALDRRTGKEIWKRPRPSGDKTAYSVPCVFQPEGGQPQLIFHSSANGVTGVEAATGRVLWSISEVFAKRCVNSPVIAGGLIFGACGQGSRGDAVVAVRPPASPAEKPQVAYQIRQAAPYVITPVAYQDLLFVWQDLGIVTCLEAATGKVHWRERIGGNYSGSPVRVGKHVYCVSDDGAVAVLAASEKYRLVARNELGERSRATPAVAGGRMYLRTESQLISLGGG